MKKSIFFSLVMFTFLFSACSEEDTIDDSAIKNKTFKLTSLTLSKAVDLNLDGNASFNMIDEFSCIGDETIRFNDLQNQINYTDAPLLGVATDISDPNNIKINYYKCNDMGGMFNFGNYKMINENTVEVEISPMLSDQSYKVRYTIAENMLIVTSKRNYPTTYDVQTQTWTSTQLEVRKEFTRL